MAAEYNVSKLTHSVSCLQCEEAALTDSVVH